MISYSMNVCNTVSKHHLTLDSDGTHESCLFIAAEFEHHGAHLLSFQQGRRLQGRE